MRAYIDSSVVLRIVFGEKNALRLGSELEDCAASEILKIECLRTIDRMRHSLRLSERDTAERYQLLHKALRSIKFIKLSASISERAGQAFPTTIKTLDAIHLSSALIWQGREKNFVFLTHDQHLAQCARATGLAVMGC